MQVCKYFESKHFWPKSYLAQTFSNRAYPAACASSELLRACFLMNLFQIFTNLYQNGFTFWSILSSVILDPPSAPLRCLIRLVLWSPGSRPSLALTLISWWPAPRWPWWQWQWCYLNDLRFNLAYLWDRWWARSRVAKFHGRCKK